MLFDYSALEGKFQSELHESRRVSQCGDRAEVFGVEVVQISRLSELRVVERVEGFGPELQTRCVVYLEVLEDRSIEVIPAGTAGLLRVSAQDGVVQLADLGRGGWLKKCVRIQPLGWVAGRSI